ncbi:MULTISPECIES: YceI family protein [unclassified Janibacter]|uniref:YceI family protein n=1 Tax=unclassified Janibacter TaxID=2649294 RepID=UPI003D08DBBB
MPDNELDLNGTWELDPGHTRLGFSARHAMITSVRGSFNDVHGEFFVDVEDLSRSHASIVIKAASVDTRNQQRDDHLRSPDFFDVERFPAITFQSTSIEEIHEGAYIVTGDLTIRDITKQITVPLELAGVQVDAFGVTRAGFEGSRRVNRRDYGLEWNMPLDKGGVLVSEKIDLEFEISATKKADGSGDQQG